MDIDRLEAITCIQVNGSENEHRLFMGGVNSVRPVNASPIVNKKRERERKAHPKLGSETNNQDIFTTPWKPGAVLTGEMVDWATRKCVGIDIDHETEKFIDWIKTKGTDVDDWIVAWRRWMMRAVDFRAQALSPRNRVPLPVPLTRIELEAMLKK